MPTRIVIAALGDLVAERYTVTAYCEAGRGCQHSTELDLGRLVERLGGGFPNSQLAARLRCAACGSKTVGIRLHLPRDKDGFGGVDRCATCARFTGRSGTPATFKVVAARHGH